MVGGANLRGGEESRGGDGDPKEYIAVGEPATGERSDARMSVGAVGLPPCWLSLASLTSAMLASEISPSSPLDATRRDCRGSTSSLFFLSSSRLDASPSSNILLHCSSSASLFSLATSSGV